MAPVPCCYVRPPGGQRRAVCIAPCPPRPRTPPGPPSPPPPRPGGPLCCHPAWPGGMNIFHPCPQI